MKEIALAIHAVKDFDSSIISGLEGLNYIHVDVMDGKLVKSINKNLESFRILKERSELPIVAHLMVLNPKKYINKIIKHTDSILFHFEIEENIREIIKLVKKHGKKVGLVINPKTEVSCVLEFLDKIDYVLVMSVNPGWSGQKFIENTINKIDQLSQYKKRYNFKIIVDGGINLDNAKSLDKADILSSSSTILRSEDPNDVIKALKQF